MYSCKGQLKIEFIKTFPFTKDVLSRGNNLFLYGTPSQSIVEKEDDRKNGTLIILTTIENNERFKFHHFSPLC